jgi:hypothetical protein
MIAKVISPCSVPELISIGRLSRSRGVLLPGPERTSPTAEGSIAISDVRGLCFLECGKQVPCGCCDIVLPESFKFGNDPAQANDLPRTGCDDVLRRRQLLQ